MKSGRRNPLLFVPSPMDVVDMMLSVSDPSPDEVLVDLGSGDGRIIINASRNYGCLSIGVEKNPRLVDLTTRRIHSAEIRNAKVYWGDIHEYDISRADVVTLYLLPETLSELRPKLLMLKKGARVVSHDFKIPGMTPAEEYQIKSSETGRIHTIYLYVMK